MIARVISCHGVGRPRWLSEDGDLPIHGAWEGVLGPASKSITSRHMCLTHKNRARSQSAEPREGKRGAFLPPPPARWSGPPGLGPGSLTGLGHISLLTNLSHRCGNKTVLPCIHLTPAPEITHQRGQGVFSVSAPHKAGIQFDGQRSNLPE